MVITIEASSRALTEMRLEVGSPLTNRQPIS
jgi:hypothetical protein